MDQFCILSWQLSLTCNVHLSLDSEYGFSFHWFDISKDFFLVNFRMYPQQSQETTTTRWLLSVGLSDRLKQVQALWPLNGIPKLKATGLNAILSATLMDIWRNMSYENEDWLFQMVKHHESPRFGLICCAAGSARRMRWQRRCTGNWATTWRATALSLSCRGATCETL